MSAMGVGEGSPREQGAALLREGRFAEAAVALRRAVEQNPLDNGAWQLLGAALSGAGDTAGGVAAFEKTVALAPDSARNHYNLALALQTVSRLDEARMHFEQALALAPGYGQARTALDALAAGGAASGPAPTLREASAGGMARADDDLAVVGGGFAGGGETARTPQLAPGAVEAYAPPPVLGTGYSRGENTSGMHGEVPVEVQGGWNWGAAVIPVFWLWSHQMQGFAWGVFALNLVGRFLGRQTGTAALGLVVSLIQIGLFFYLGVTGNKQGWQNRRFDSVEDFKDCQRRWMYWALPLFLLLVLIIGAAVVLPAMNAAAGGVRTPPRSRPF